MALVASPETRQPYVLELDNSHNDLAPPADLQVAIDGMSPEQLADGFMKSGQRLDELAMREGGIDPDKADEILRTRAAIALAIERPDEQAVDRRRRELVASARERYAGLLGSSTDVDEVVLVPREAYTSDEATNYGSKRMQWLRQPIQAIRERRENAPRRFGLGTKIAAGLLTVAALAGASTFTDEEPVAPLPSEVAAATANLHEQTAETDIDFTAESPTIVLEEAQPAQPVPAPEGMSINNQSTEFKAPEEGQSLYNWVLTERFDGSNVTKQIHAAVEAAQANGLNVYVDERKGPDDYVVYGFVETDNGEVVHTDNPAELAEILNPYLS